MEKLKTYPIVVNNCCATYNIGEYGKLVCGNPFNLEFTFDSEWDSYADITKKAKIKFHHKGRDKHINIEFSGNTCRVPALFGIKQIEVGVFIDDDIYTTTGAIIPCEKSIRCDASTSVFGAEAIDNINQALKGEKGDKGDKGDPGIQGKQGDTGKSVFIAYSHHADGTDFSDKWDEGQKYIGIATDYKAPTSKSAYDWTQVISSMPKLKSPKSATTDSRCMTVTFENQDAPFVIKNNVYLNGKEIATVENVESVDFSKFVGDRVVAEIGVSAIADGFNESEPIKTTWKLTNGSEVEGLVYTLNELYIPDDSYLLTSIPIDAKNAPLEIASHIDGKPIVGVNGVKGYYITVHEVLGFIPNSCNYESIDFLGGVDSIDNSFNGAIIGRLYLPSVDTVFKSFGEYSGSVKIIYASIDRLYSYENLPSEIISAVKELSGSASNGFKRINTWCIGVGEENGYEYAIKEDNTARLTYDSMSPAEYYAEIIPDMLGGLPVNGLGKFYKYADNYLREVTFGDNMENINESAFRNCVQLHTVTFGKGLKTVSDHAFRYCPIKKLDFTNTALEELKGRAFGNNTALTEIRLPATVKTIASSAFAGDTNVTDIYVSWSEGDVANAPWGATKATIHYNS